MSWQDYVDKQLLASRCVTSAAIAGHDGNIWASSEGFDVSRVCSKAAACLYALKWLQRAGLGRARSVIPSSSAGKICRMSDFFQVEWSWFLTTGNYPNSLVSVWGVPTSAPAAGNRRNLGIWITLLCAELWLRLCYTSELKTGVSSPDYVYFCESEWSRLVFGSPWRKTAPWLL